MSSSKARRDACRLRAGELLADLAAERDHDVDVTSAFERADEALGLAGQAGWREGIAFALLQKARRQSSPEVYETLLQAIGLFRRLGHGSGEADALNNLGLVYRDDGQTTLALHFLMLAHELIVDLDGSAPRDHALVLLNLAGVSFEYSDIDLAMAISGEALDFCRRHKLDDLLARTLWMTGHALWRGGLDQIALHYTREALHVLDGAMSWDRAQAEAAYAGVALDAGLDREAADHGLDAIEQFLRLDAGSDRGLALLTVGVARMHLGEMAAAERCFEEAARIGEQSGSRRIYVCALRMLGDLLIRDGRVDDGIEHARASLLIADQIGNRVMQGLACAVLYRGARALDDTATALDYLERALLLAPGFARIEREPRFGDLPVHGEIEALWRRQATFMMTLPA
jgi:tetratricopeptide (TPR) repeat protein